MEKEYKKKRKKGGKEERKRERDMHSNGQEDEFVNVSMKSGNASHPKSPRALLQREGSEGRGKGEGKGKEGRGRGR